MLVFLPQQNKHFKFQFMIKNWQTAQGRLSGSTSNNIMKKYLNNIIFKNYIWHKLCHCRDWLCTLWPSPKFLNLILVIRPKVMRHYRNGENNKSQNWCHSCILEDDLSTHMGYFFLPGC